MRSGTGEKHSICCRKIWTSMSRSKSHLRRGTLVRKTTIMSKWEPPILSIYKTLVDSRRSSLLIMKSPQTTPALLSSKKSPKASLLIDKVPLQSMQHLTHPKNPKSKDSINKPCSKLVSSKNRNCKKKRSPHIRLQISWTVKVWLSSGKITELIHMCWNLSTILQEFYSRAEMDSIRFGKMSGCIMIKKEDFSSSIRKK